MKVIIAGSRTINNYKIVCKAMAHVEIKPTQVVSGGARGIDVLGVKWAVDHNVSVRRFYPDWKKLGKRAGPERNRRMAEYADFLVAIWDGKSRGTKNMIETMLKMGKPFIVFKKESERWKIVSKGCLE